MAEETLKLTSRGRWEKILAGSYGWLFFLAMFTSSLLQQDLGFWGSTAIGVASLGLGALLLVRLAAPERKYRLARDAERGIIECAIRYPDSHPGSLRHRWLPGFAQVTRGALKFQPDLSGEGNPNGTIRPFSNVILKERVEAPAKRPAELKRGWIIVALETDEGRLQVATGDRGLQLIDERLGNHGE